MEGTKLTFLRTLSQRRQLFPGAKKVCKRASTLDPWEPVGTLRTRDQLRTAAPVKNPPIRRASTPNNACRAVSSTHVRRAVTPGADVSRPLSCTPDADVCRRLACTGRRPSTSSSRYRPSGQCASRPSSRGAPEKEGAWAVRQESPWTTASTRASTPVQTRRSATRPNHHFWESAQGKEKELRRSLGPSLSGTRASTPARERTPSLPCRARTPNTPWRDESGAMGDAMSSRAATPVKSRRNPNREVSQEPSGRTSVDRVSACLSRVLRSDAMHFTGSKDQSDTKPDLTPESPNLSSCLALDTYTFPPPPMTQTKPADWNHLQCAHVGVTLRQAACERKRRLLATAEKTGVQQVLSRGSSSRVLSDDLESIVRKWNSGRISGRMAWLQFSLLVDLGEGTSPASVLPSLIGAPRTIMHQFSVNSSLYQSIFQHSPKDVREMAWNSIRSEKGTGDDAHLTLKRLAMRAKGRSKQEYCVIQIWRLLLEGFFSEEDSARDNLAVKLDQQIALSGKELEQDVKLHGVDTIRQQNDDLASYLNHIVSAKRHLSTAVKDLEQSTYFTILGVSPQSTDEDVKRAFVKLARTSHPDKGGDAEAFANIHQAYVAIISQREGQPVDTPEESAFNAIKSWSQKAQREADMCARVAVTGLHAAQCLVRASKVDGNSSASSGTGTKAAKTALEVARSVIGHTKSVADCLRLIAKNILQLSPSLADIATKVDSLATAALGHSVSLSEVTRAFSQMMYTYEAQLPNTPVACGVQIPHGIGSCAERLAHHLRICATTTTDSAEASIEVTQCVEDERASKNQPPKQDSEASAGSTPNEQEKRTAEDNITDKHCEVVDKRIQLSTMIRQANAGFRAVQAKTWELLRLQGHSATNLFDVHLDQKKFVFALVAEILDDACVTYDASIQKLDLRDKDSWIDLAMSPDGPMGFLQKIATDGEFSIHPDVRVQLIQLARAIDIDGVCRLVSQCFDRIWHTLKWWSYRPQLRHIESQALTKAQLDRFGSFQSETLKICSCYIAPASREHE